MTIRLPAEELMTVISSTNAERRAEAAEHRLRADERRWPHEIRPSVDRPAPEPATRVGDPRGTWPAAAR